MRFVGPKAFVQLSADSIVNGVTYGKYTALFGRLLLHTDICTAELGSDCGLNLFSPILLLYLLLRLQLLFKNKNNCINCKQTRDGCTMPIESDLNFEEF